MAETMPSSNSLTARRRRRNERRRKSKSISNVSFCFLLWLTNHITDRLVRGRIQSGEGYRSEKRGSETRGRLEQVETGASSSSTSLRRSSESLVARKRHQKIQCAVGFVECLCWFSRVFKTNLSRYPRSNPQDSISQIVMIIKHNH